MLIQQNADTAAQSSTARGVRGGAAPPSPRRAAYVHRMVAGMFERAVQTHDNPLALSLHQSRLQREQVRQYVLLAGVLGGCLSHTPSAQEAWTELLSPSSMAEQSKSSNRSADDIKLTLARRQRQRPQVARTPRRKRQLEGTSPPSTPPCGTVYLLSPRPVSRCRAFSVNRQLGRRLRAQAAVRSEIARVSTLFHCVGGQSIVHTS